MLWIALHLPLLSLESFAATLAASAGERGADRPLALLDAHRIVGANAAAQALGVKPGLKRATALALAPQHRARPGRPGARRRGACCRWRMRRSPSRRASRCSRRASRARPPHTVLLEVQASLRYFGGLERLLQRLQRRSRRSATRVRIASAATAQGAALLARVQPPPRCADLAATRRGLDAAPVWLLGPGREHWDALQGMGLRTLGDLLSLPRAGLARRFGEALLAELDARFGRRPDPRVPIVLPPAVREPARALRPRRHHRAGAARRRLLLARLVPGWRRSMRSCAASRC